MNDESRAQGPALEGVCCKSTEPRTPDANYRADGPWIANFERMARRAAADPDYYEIAGRNVQALADAIRDGRWPA